jgi:hypothetical protein
MVPLRAANDRPRAKREREDASKLDTLVPTETSATARKPRLRVKFSAASKPWDGLSKVRQAAIACQTPVVTEIWRGLYLQTVLEHRVHGHSPDCGLQAATCATSALSCLPTGSPPLVWGWHCCCGDSWCKLRESVAFLTTRPRFGFSGPRSPPCRLPHRPRAQIVACLSFRPGLVRQCGAEAHDSAPATTSRKPQSVARGIDCCDPRAPTPRSRLPRCKYSAGCFTGFPRRSNADWKPRQAQTGLAANRPKTLLA